MSLPTIRLLRKIEVASDTMAFHFEKPDGFEFRAGQYADYTLVDPPEIDTGGDTREFTFSSAPFEDDLACTVRVRQTAFKRVLHDMPIGTEVEMDAPYGSFVLHRRETRPAVFLTGGVGVTPARSILLQADHERTGHRIVLLRSDKTPASAPYLDELQALDRSNPNITVVATMTAPEAVNAGWRGLTGHIDAALLTRYVPDVTEPIFYLCGPAKMVRGMRDVLADAGVDDDDVRTEEFLGY